MPESKKPAKTGADTKVPVVAIGASAGGLEPITQIVAGLDASFPAAVVVALHLSPHHESRLANILEHDVQLQVDTVRNGDVLQPGWVYVVPPNRNVEIVDGAFVTSPAAKGPYPKPSVDLLFRSLAASHAEYAIGVVLSGTGSDGAAGVRALKLAGGVTIVQDPETATYDGMPLAAVGTDCVDLVADAAKLAEVITSVVSSPIEPQLPAGSQRERQLRQIIDCLKAVRGVDFSYTKPSTLYRRIARRCSLNADQDLAPYIERLQQDPDEARALANSILISVTAFFRDKEVWLAVREELKKQLAAHPTGEPFRAWVPACATGEEAYTLAMILLDLTQSMDSPPSITIFATDLAEHAVEIARTGIYTSDSLANLPAGYRDRFLAQSGDGYRVRSRVRQITVFSVHNLISDPPFSKLDVVSCRNFLIYLKNDYQRAILELMHYALKPRGMLVLGSTESTSTAEGRFVAISETHRIYRRDQTVERFPSRFKSQIDAPFRAAQTPARRAGMALAPESLQTAAQIALANYATPRWVVVDEHDIVKFISAEARALIRAPTGPAIMRIHDVLANGLDLELRGVLYRARRERKPVTGSRVNCQLADGWRSVTPHAIPLDGEFERSLLLMFELREMRSAEAERRVQESLPDSLDSDYVRALESRVEILRQDMQSMAEELETSNEELQSQSEELQSSNEELQSMNEQLLTSNEELQSSNEELITVNEELRQRGGEMDVLTASWDAVGSYVDDVIIVVDAAARVRLLIGPEERLYAEGAVRQSSDRFWSLPWRSGFMPMLSAVRKRLEREEDGPLHLRLEDEQAECDLRAIDWSSPDIRAVVLRIRWARASISDPG